MSAAEGRTRNLPNYYLALDITPGVSHNEILHAYNRSKKTYSNGSVASYGLLDVDSATSVLEEIETAFAVLGNPSKRREYDIRMGYKTWSEDGETEAPEMESPAMITTLKHIQDEGARAAPRAAEPVSSPREGVIKFAPAAKKVTQSAPPASQRRVDSNFEPNPEFEKQIAECVSPDGAFLRAVRIYRRFSTEELASRCKLSSSHVDTVEGEDSERMPQSVYLRGHVLLICQALEMPEPEALARAYVARMKDQGKLPKGPF